MTEQEIVYLSGPDSPIGISRHDAQLRLVDDDLWLLDAEGRYGFEDDEAVQQWAQAVDAIQIFIHMGRYVNEATEQLLIDARVRAEEALRRARARAA
jgi:hypothetical protein